MPASPVANASSPYFLSELIPEVARRLTSLQDFFALRAACRGYRALLPLTASNLASQAPLLLLISRDRIQSHALFHFPLRRIHRLHLPRTRTSMPDGDDVITISHTLGCHLAVNNIDYRLPKRDLSIIHLLTGEQACLPSPRAPISRLIRFGDLVVAWSGDVVHYGRLGAPRWRMARTSFPNELEDLIFVKGTLYALVNPDHRLAVVELPDDDNNNYNNLKLAFLGRQFDSCSLLRSVVVSCYLLLGEEGSSLFCNGKTGKGSG